METPRKTVPGVYAIFFVMLSERANALGYALAVHGSMARDLDLIAVPWRVGACDADVLAADLAAAIGGVIENDPNAQPGDWQRRNPQPKPHGRLAYSIQLGGGPYIDLSVMPKKPTPVSGQEEENPHA